MKTRVFLLILLLATLSSAGEPTNLVEILRQFQAQLDAEEGLIPEEAQAPPPVEPVRVEPVMDTVEIRRLRAGDLLKVEIVDEPDMSAERVAVAPNGTVMLPMVGPVPVAGKTVEEAREGIRALLEQDYLVDPQVNLTYLQQETWPEPIPKKVEVPVAPVPAAAPASSTAEESVFTIAGQVNKPGRYTWDRRERMSILRSIGQAGGITPRADLTQVVVRRVIGGEKLELRLDLSPTSRDSNAKALPLQSGDEVEVPSK